MPDHGKSLFTGSVLLSGREIMHNTECASTVQNVRRILCSKPGHSKRNKNKSKVSLDQSTDSLSCNHILHFYMLKPVKVVNNVERMGSVLWSSTSRTVVFAIPHFDGALRIYR